MTADPLVPADAPAGTSLDTEVDELRALVLALSDTVAAVVDDLDDPKAAAKTGPKGRKAAREQVVARRPPVEAAAARRAARLATRTGDTP